MGTRASAGGEGNRGGDRAKSARDHAEGSGRAHPCGSTSPLWSCFVTHLCYEVPEHADEEHGEGDGDHHPVPHVGVEHPFFWFRFEGTAGYCQRSAWWKLPSVRERESERKGSFSGEATGEASPTRAASSSSLTTWLPYLSFPRLPQPPPRSVWPMKSPRGASDGILLRPPFEIPPSKDLGERRLGGGVFSLIR